MIPNLVIALLALLMPGAVLAMDFTQSANGITLSGQIRAGDYERLLAHYRSTPEKFVTNQTFRLNSEGGSVLEAIKIAHFVKSTLRVTLVTADDKCLSSCFLILVAGGERIVSDSRVGIHRPYYATEDFKVLRPAQAREAYVRADAEVRAFLAELRVPDEVVREMFATPSTDIKLFTEAEFNRRVGSVQPWFDELAKSACPPDPYQRLRFMGLKSAVDRLDMVRTYLGSSADTRIAAWAKSYREWAGVQLAAGHSGVGEESRTSRVDSAHPGWRDTVKTNDFALWLEVQPPAVRELANSQKQEDAIRLLDAYKLRSGERTARTASSPILHLTCTLSWNTGQSGTDTLDFAVDLEGRRVGSAPADITDESISFVRDLSGRRASTRINRRSGSISIFMEGLGTMVGNCRRAGERRF